MRKETISCHLCILQLTSLNVKLMAVQEMWKFAVKLVKCSFAIGKFLRQGLSDLRPRHITTLPKQWVWWRAWSVCYRGVNETWAWPHSLTMTTMWPCCKHSTQSTRRWWIAPCLWIVDVLLLTGALLKANVSRKRNHHFFILNMKNFQNSWPAQKVSSRNHSRT